jgi:hypothetical protein
MIPAEQRSTPITQGCCKRSLCWWCISLALSGYSCREVSYAGSGRAQVSQHHALREGNFWPAEGPLAFDKGVGPRLTRVCLEVGITMSLYGEIVKAL